MKKLSAVLAVVFSLCLVVTLAFAGDTMKGTVKSVDEKAGTIVVTVDGKDHSLKLDKDADVKGVKAGGMVTVTVDGGVAKKVEAKRKAPIGC